MSKRDPLIEADLSKAEILVKIAKGKKQLRGKRGENRFESDKTLYDTFKIKWVKEKSDYDDTESVIKRRTLDRRYKNLIDEGYIVEKDHFCYLNLEKILDFGKLGISQQETIRSVLLECEDFESYCLLREKDEANKYKLYYSDEELKQLNRSVKNRSMRFINDEDSIKKINTAIANHEEITIHYKPDKNKEGEIKSIFPLCYVINRRGTKCYLFNYVKKRMGPPLDMEYISVPKTKNKKNRPPMNTELFEEKIEIVKKLWDVGGNESSEEVTIYLKNNSEGKEIRKDLLESGWTEKETELDGYILCGEVYGLSDFSVFVRSHMSSCYVLKPEKFRNDIMDALKTKIDQYEEMKL